MSTTGPADRRPAPAPDTRCPPARAAAAPSRRTALLLSAVAAGALAGCGLWKRDIGGTVLKSDQTRAELTLAEAPGLRAAVGACDALGAALLSAQLADGAHANALASPASLALNLAAASLGATDPAAQGLNELLGAADEEARNTTWSAIQTALLAHDGDVSGFKPDSKAPEHPLVHVADQIVVVDHGKPAEVGQDFVDDVRRWFSADLRRADVGKAQDVLDEWVKQNTADLIKSSALDATKIDVALQNAVLFAAQWKELFDKKSTQDEDFTRADGSVIQVPMMRQQSSMVCTEGTTGSVTWKVLRVPYSEDFALDIVLPDKGTLPEALPADTWAAASALLDEAEREGLSPEVNLWLPRIDLTSPDGGIDILPVLESLGADIRPMGRISPQLETTAYRQQVRLIVREDGTVAAAVSEHGDAATAPNLGPITDFHVDHPYVMRLRDLSTGVALFEAVINGPS